MFKKIALTLIAVVVLLIAALAIFAATFDANNYKDEIKSLAKAQTGRDLQIDGDLKLAIYPDLALEMGKTSLSNAEGFSGKNFATVESARVSVKLLPILKKQVKADAILLSGLKLNLHRNANGTSNWDDLSKNDSSQTSKVVSNTETARTVEEVMQNLSIAGVSLKDAHIHWRDDQAKQDLTISPLNLSTGKFTQGKPLAVELDVVVKQKSPAMTIAADGSTTVTLSNNNKKFNLSKLKLQTKITGAQLPNGALTANLVGDITGNPKNISIDGLSLQSVLTGDLIPEGELKTNLTGDVNIDLTGQLVQIQEMKLNADANGKALDNGTLHAVITGNTKLDLVKQLLSIPNLALKANVKEGYIKGGTANANITANTQFNLASQFLNLRSLTMTANANGDLFQGGKANTAIKGDIQVSLANAHVKSPKITINSAVEGGIVPGGKLNQSANGTMDVNWAKNTGGINLSDLMVNVAGLDVKGHNVKINPLAEKPAISGQFQTNTFNLKNLLKILGIEAPVTSNPKALTQLQAQFGLTANTDNSKLSALKLKVDQSQVNGNLEISNFAAPAIRTNLQVNSINLDDYLAPKNENGSTATASSNSADNANNKELLPMDTLRQLNINGNFNIGKLIINKLTMTKINAKVDAKQGLININPANAQLYKGKYVGRITLDAKQQTPSMNMRHEITGVRSEGLLFDLFQDKYLSGGAKLTTDLNSRGNTLDDLLKNLNGTTKMDFSEGTIRDSSFAEKVSLAVKAFEKKEIKDGKSVVNFTGLSGDWKTTNGVFSTDNLSMLSPYFNIQGTGTADVANQKLNMKLRIGPNKQNAKRPLFAPLKITGTFEDPKFSLDLKDLIKALAAQDLKELEDKARAKLDEEKQALKLKLENEKAKQKAKLKLKADKAKADALQKLKAKTGDKLGNQIMNKITGEKPAPTEGSGEATEAPKSVEDQVKDKLKNKLRSLF